MNFFCFVLSISFQLNDPLVINEHLLGSFYLTFFLVVKRFILHWFYVLGCHHCRSTCLHNTLGNFCRWILCLGQFIKEWRKHQLRGNILTCGSMLSALSNIPHMLYISLQSFKLIGLRWAWQNLSNLNIWNISPKTQ